jgi:Ca2+-binding RTX toxin-like protein
MTEITGSAGNDSLDGTTGADLFLLQQGGDDGIAAGDADDIVYFGTTLAAGDSVDGGFGDDRVLIQGNYSLTLAGGLLSRVERLLLLSSGDSTYGGGGALPFNYSLSLSDALFAAGTSFIIDASGLAAGEALVFDGSLESDATLYVYAGAGDDILTAAGRRRRQRSARWRARARHPDRRPRRRRLYHRRFGRHDRRRPRRRG